MSSVFIESPAGCRRMVAIQNVELSNLGPGQNWCPTKDVGCQLGRAERLSPEVGQTVSFPADALLSSRFPAFPYSALSAHLNLQRSDC